MTSTRRSPKRDDGRRRRDDLLDATLRCFARTGVQKTRVADIRREAGANASSIYHQFNGLPGLTVALLSRTFARLFRALNDRVVPAATAEEAVTALVRAHVDWVLAHRDEARVMYQAMTLGFGDDDAATLLSAKAEALAPTVQRLMQFMQDGSLPPLPPLELEVIVMGPAHEACRRLLLGAPLDPEWLRSALPRLAWRSVTALLEG